MKFNRSNKFDFCYYGQVNTYGVTFILLAIVRLYFHIQTVLL